MTATARLRRDGPQPESQADRKGDDARTDAPPPHVVGLLATTTIALGLVGPGVASAAAPTAVGPKNGAVLALGSRPVFKVRDSASNKYPLYIAISTSKKVKQNGDLKRTSIGTFASMKRKGSLFTYKTPNYSFPTWFMARPGTSYWQAYRIDCSVSASCHVQTKVRSFKVK